MLKILQNVTVCRSDSVPRSMPRGTSSGGRSGGGKSSGSGRSATSGRSAASSSATTSNLIFKADGSIDQRCQAFRQGLVYETDSGKLDGRCIMARSGEIRQNADGSYDQRFNAVKNASQNVAKKELTANHLRSPNAQNKYREQSTSQNKNTQDVAHKLSLDTAITCIQSMPGSISQEQLAQFKTEINDFKNFNMKNSTVNRSDDKIHENRINKQISGEDVESPTCVDRYKNDLGLKFAQYQTQNSSKMTRNMWIYVAKQLQGVRDTWEQ